MKMIAPIVVTDAVLASTNVPETDHPAWAGGTTYALGARVIVASTHSVYESVQAGNIGQNPATDSDSSHWIRVGATNRWRAFDQRTGQATTRADSIEYQITLASLCTAVALVGLSARSVRIRVISGGVTVYDQTRSVADGSGIVSWLTYFTYIPEYAERAVFENIPGYAGSTLRINIDAAGGVAEVGEIIAGRMIQFGKTLVDTEISFEDMSIRERDDFGNVYIVERQSYDVITFRFAIPVGGEERVRRAIRDTRAKPAFFYADTASATGSGLAVFGLAKPLRIPLQSAGVSIATLETEELS